MPLPAISLGMWHNFGAAGTDSGRRDEAALHDNAAAMMQAAFDRGVTHFDLANNYGPPPGSAEERVGRILREHFATHRDELVISTKAGYRMFDGPYQDGGSRKYLLDSCAASLRRLGLDHVDLFYHHRPDPTVPLEETMGALDHLVRVGDARYVGLSNYSAAQLAAALEVCDREGLVRPIIHQCPYSALDRGFGTGALPVGADAGLGAIVFSPLAQGLLTDKYIDAIPVESRASTESVFLGTDRITPELQAALRSIRAMARDRGQSVAQLALGWVLADPRITSALIGASRVEQVEQCCDALAAAPLTSAERDAITEVFADH
jgi:L-glyceraldehyde 3-phosphate reductase